MSDKLVVSWVINSINQTSQQIHRKIDDGEEELLSILGPLETTFLDETALELTTDVVAYRISSVANFRGIEIIESSETKTYVITNTIDVSNASRFTTVDTTGAVVIGQRFRLLNIQDQTEIPAVPYNGVSAHHIVQEIPIGQYAILIDDMTQPLNGVAFLGGVSELASWHGAGYSVDSLATGGNVDYALLFANSSIQKVPSDLHPSITTTAMMFSGSGAFNDPVINNWDMSHVTNTQRMFEGVVSFNQPLNSWVTDSLVNTSGMFQNATNFNQDISMWNMSNVIDTSAMFNGATVFNQPLDAWDVSRVTTMSNMFEDAKQFNQPLDSWDTSNVTDMTSLFQLASTFNRPVDHFNTSKVTTMAYMFTEAISFNQPLDNWDVSNVMYMVGMFAGASAFSQDLSGWCITNVTTLPLNFAENAPLLTTDKYPVWGTCPVASNALVFTSSGESVAFEGQFGDELHYPDGTVEPLLDEGKFNKVLPAGNYTIIPVSPRGVGTISLTGPGLTHVIQLPEEPAISRVKFNDDEGGAYSLIGVPAYLPPNLTDLTSMFSGCLAIDDPNISGWDVSKVTTMSDMFAGATTFNQPLDDWDVSNVVDMQNMFNSALEFNQDISMWNMSNVTNIEAMFAGASVFNQPIGSWDVSNVTRMAWVFQDTVSFNQPINSWDVSKVETMAQMFERSGAFNQPLDDWDVSNVTSMSGMFSRAAAFKQDLSGWCVSQVSELPFYFVGYIDFPEEYKPVWGTCPVTKKALIFTSSGDKIEYKGYAGDILKYPNGTQDVLSSGGMISKNLPAGEYVLIPAKDRKAGTISLSGSGLVGVSQLPAHPLVTGIKFNTDAESATLLTSVPAYLPPNLTDLSSMFLRCLNLNDPNISLWDTSNVTTMSNMFQNATNFNQDISSWDVSNVVDMQYMFAAASNFNQPIGSWDVSNVKYMTSMFSSAAKFNQDLSSWCVIDMSSSTSMIFNNAPIQEEFKPVWGTCPTR